MHQQYIYLIHRWKYSSQEANKRYSWSTSITSAVIILKCTRERYPSCQRSVDILGSCGPELFTNSLIISLKSILICLWRWPLPFLLSPLLSCLLFDRNPNPPLCLLQLIKYLRKKGDTKIFSIHSCCIIYIKTRHYTSLNMHNAGFWMRTTYCHSVFGWSYLLCLSLWK